ncbi:flagellar attachment zone protein, putative [Leishmania panamensis]|uniref:Flagellar attachment zone protein, putative n=2 Tax=Leishmania panamensis TaxID=5679 RepID=A0A088RNC0_LEIPA
MLAAYVDPPAHQLRVGQVVVYDYLHAAKTWQWTLGTVREITDYTAIVQQWGPHTGDSDTLRSILLREVDTENGRMKSYQDMLALAREKLASIRRSNEDRVSRVRGHFDKAREELERIDEVDLRKVTAQAAPSPVAVAVLKAVWAVAKCDPTAVEFYEWADVQLEYRRRAALDEIAKMDVLAKLYPSAESLQQSLEHGPKLNYKAAARDSPVVASLHAWATTALAYQQAYSLLAHDKRIQEQNDAIAAAIAGMKACRAKIAKLKEELSSNGTTTLPEQVTSFTRTSVLVTIPLSAVISPVSVDSRMKECVLTKDVVKRIPVDAKITRYEQKQKLAITVSHFLDQYAAAISTRIYATELEERLFLIQHYLVSALRDAQADAVEQNQRLAASLQELEAFRQKRHDAKKARITEPELVDADSIEPNRRRTSSCAAPRGTPSQHPSRSEVAHQSIDPATIAKEPLYAVTIDEYKAKDTAGQRAAAEVDRMVDEVEYMTDEVQRLTAELEDAKVEAGRLAEELVAKDEELKAFRQKRHDAKKARASDPVLAAADAVAPCSVHAAYATPNSSRKGAAPPFVGAVPHQAFDPITMPVSPAVVAAEPLYMATAEELQHVRDVADQLAEQAVQGAAAREAEVYDAMSNLEGELDVARARIAQLEDVAVALKMQLSGAEEAGKKVTDALEVAEKERQQLCDDLEAALDELELKKEEYDQLLGNLEEVQVLLEASNVAERNALEALEQRNRNMVDLQGDLAHALVVSKENENLRAQLEAKEREINKLKEHNELWTDPVDTRTQKVTHRFTKIFEGDWCRLVRKRPEALKAAFLIDSSNACHVPGDQIGFVDFVHDW